MEHLLNPKVKKLEISGIRKFFNMAAGVDNVISLTIGQPDFPTPVHIKEAAKKAIDEDFTTYTHNAGILSLRQAAAKFVLDKYDLTYSAEDEIIVTSGASEAIDIAFRTILQEGDEVILPGPIYPGYEPIIRLCGATPIFADITHNQFRFTANIIENYITSRTKAVVIPYPSNPTGVSLNKMELQEIADLLKGKDIFIIADEIYSELTYEKKHISIGTMLREQTIVINGLSKSHSMTGWRIGLLFAPKSVAKHILKVHQYNVSCASSISQKAALEALTIGENDAEIMKAEYKGRRDYVYERLIGMGLDVIKPDGAFYFFVKHSENKISLDYALSLVHKAKVAVIPGSAFSSLGEGYFRLSYAYSMEQLKEGLDRLENFMKEKA